jgi:hypothetical protein
MIELTQEEWTLILIGGIIFFGWLLTRSKIKEKRIKNAPHVAAILHRKSVLAQMESLDGVSKSTLSSFPILQGMTRDDEYIRAAIGMESNKQDFIRQAMDASRGFNGADGVMFNL